ncbi:MAG: tRNA pseudouridine(38-40) synthase TruA [Phycisphaerae bacterium]|nr:tRNA pseudouridine(38-40) synthase TruA [Phycisphaerae bacterium]
MDDKNRKLKLVIAYNGAMYRGWQRQADGIDTVQLRVETAAKYVLRHPLHVHGCSRTDSGVHAEGQVAHIRTSSSIPVVGMRKAMNSRLPKDIVIRSVCDVPMSFNSSLSAVGKTYRYRIHMGPGRPVHLAGQVYCHWKSLDTDAMSVAACKLVGEHDFRGFASSADKRQITVRKIFSCHVAPIEHENEIHVTISGNGFLYNMVRNIVGTLIDVGRGRWAPTQIDKIIETRDRDIAGPTTPPDGLTLMCVNYPPEALQF